VASQIDTGQRFGYELRFPSLINPAQVLAFPCDASGIVDLDRLGNRALNSYLYARTLIGREFSVPIVQACGAS
jgi:hypothetical protein